MATHEQKEHICKNLTSLLKTTVVNEHLLSILVSEDILTRQEANLLQELPTEAAKWRLYDLIETRVNGYEIMAFGLQETRQSGACGILKEILPNPPSTYVSKQTILQLSQKIISSKQLETASYVFLGSGAVLIIIALTVSCGKFGLCGLLAFIFGGAGKTAILVTGLEEISLRFKLKNF